MGSSVVPAEFGKNLGRKFQGRGGGVLLRMRDRGLAVRNRAMNGTFVSVSIASG